MCIPTLPQPVVSDVPSTACIYPGLGAIWPEDFEAIHSNQASFRTSVNT